MVQAFIKSSLADIDVPAVDIPTFFFESARRHDDFTRASSPRPLFTDGSESVTLDQLESMCARLASGLYHTAGVRAGDVVAVMLPNSVHYPAIILSALMLGAACTLVNPAYTAREIGHQLADSGASCVFTTPALRETVSSAIAEHHTIITSIFDLFHDGDFPRARIASHDACQSTVAFIPYSSGTTGNPKGVMLSHRNIIANVLQAAALVGRQQQQQRGYPSTSAGVLPMFHSFGLLFLCFLMPYSGTSTVVMAAFSMERFLQIVQDHRVTETMLVPPIINGLAKMPQVTDRYELGSLATIIVGAAPLSSDTIATLEQRMPHVRILQGYGMSEASPALSLNPVAGSRNPLSIGRLVPSVDAKVIDDSGKALGINETGELCFRGPNVMLGYVNNREETQAAIDSDGFLHTGDVGHIDEHQHVFITDRKKELIKFNGFQVAPAELEGLLLQHPRVRDCAVVGVFDEERQTEVPKAFLVLTADGGGNGSEEQARAVGQSVVKWLNGQVAYYKQLRGGFAVLDAIPKSASGKILRRMLK
ncbi:hypothetical protein IWW55_003670 [Coemansia sp. RSA 2706]|nr:hypothetical protein IWW55_003670 [Coemansia sp. RSA 2706]